MASLYFKYGTMNSGKSLLLQAVAYNYEENGNTVLVFKPSIDNRSENKIYSRTGIEREAISVFKNTSIYTIVYKHIQSNLNNNIGCILVDESQFLSKDQVLELCMIVDKLNIPVISYGLKNDFQNELFEGSKYLLLYADNVEEIRTICRCCSKKATMVIRLNAQGKIERDGDQVVIDNEENRQNYTYVPVCRFHYSYDDEFYKNY
ncbi:Thymidine kinase [compost metagenome]